MNCALCVWLSVCVCISIYYDYNIQTGSAPQHATVSVQQVIVPSEYKVSETLTHLDYFIMYVKFATRQYREVVGCF